VRGLRRLVGRSGVLAGPRLEQLVRLARSRRARFVVGGAVGVLGLAFLAIAVHRFADSPWPLSGGDPALLVGAGLLLLLSYAFKAFGWRRLFAAHERPRPLALAAANGGASVLGIALPGRFDDVVRIAIVRRDTACPANIRTLCLSLFLLGLIDAAALAPLAAAGAFMGEATSLRAALALVAGAGIGAAVLLVALPRIITSRRLQRFRVGRWLQPRTIPLRGTSHAWALVSACWVVRAVALFLLLGALGVGFSFPLALLFLCAGAAAAALPVGPAGVATQAGASAAVLVAAGVGTSEAVSVALASSALGVLAGGAIFLFAALWRAGLRLATLRAA
jgi:uncharacterized membrane protein YbhN (UPF0104 family)